MCGAEAVEWDHVKPLAKGGAHILANLRPACLSCNRSKRDRWPLPV
jgi:5-methylcytosine-specific restriction endonuclease McrA